MSAAPEPVRLRALVADDNATTRILITQLMTRWHYDVIAVADGSSAWDVLRAPDGPLLAVLDWNMPGQNGVDICRELKTRGDPYVHGILITSATDASLHSQALDNGAADFITKPIVPHELQSRLGVARRVLAYQAQLAEKNARLRLYTTELESLASSRAQQLLHADRMATLGVLVAGIAHEVNNPATFISGNAQTIGQFWADVEPFVRAHLPTEDADQQRKLEFVLTELPKAVASIQGGVKRMKKIVKGLKAYSRQEKSEHHPCDLNQCIENALSLCNSELAKRKVRVELDLRQDLPSVWADAQQLEQVFVNLTMNAAQAMQAETCRERMLTLRSRAVEPRRVRALIEDSGPGIAPALLQRIWQPFFTTKPAGEGTGLGLSICKDIIKAHDGEIWAENRADAGARFIVDLPCKAEEGAP